MSRLWDTPEFWARSEADEVLRDYPGTDVVTLADTFERSRGGHEGDPGFVRDIVAELRKRGEAGVRFWPEPAELVTLEREVRATIGRAAAALKVAGSDLDDLEPTDLPGNWWQRW